MIPKNNLFSVTILILLSCLSSSSSSDPRISEAGLYCGRNRAPLKANYIPSFIKEMESLSDLVTNHNWGTHSIKLGSIPIYGLAQCFKHLSHTDCLLCYAASRTKLPRCLPSLSARIYFDGCFLRYDNYTFYSEDTDPQRDTLNCNSPFGFVVDHSEKLVLEKSVERVLDGVVRDAVSAVNGGFSVGEFQGVYGLAQCWNTLGSSKCRKCLMKGVREIRGCLPNRQGRALNAGCYLRYSTHQFYNSSSAPSASINKRSSLRTGVIIAVVLAIAALMILTFSASYLLFTKFSNQRKENNNNMSCRILSSITKSSLNYKYETLEKATNYFNSSRKIGEGGSGSVFKGILPNGNIVAVKRLVYNNREWVDEFFNEVNLISGVEHKNLVKLLGCSIEGPESLLVYEYIPNNSLDQFIFVTEKSTNPPQILNWKERFNIIVGIAEGLNYLHEGCKIRIIHRDIKSSNVLLDENLSPKIADFGLARCLAADKTHLSTGIAGTLGYMAPEYLIRGQVTDKVDVYSFGVLVIEIICGRRNNVLREEDSGSLLQTVWKLHGSNKLGEAIDCRLGDDFAETEAEASRVFHIALLCTQASSSLRPSMLQVVQMLTNSNLQLPIPTQPPFLNTSTIHSDTTLSYYSTNSFVSNAMQL